MIDPCHCYLRDHMNRTTNVLPVQVMVRCGISVLCPTADSLSIRVADMAECLTPVSSA